MGISMFEEEEAMKQTPETLPAAHTDFVPDTNTYTHTSSRPVTPGFVILFFALVLLPFVLYYAYQWSKAGTTINTTVTTNDDLENGLVLHYTFDGPDMTLASGTREVLDISGSNNHGNWMNHATTTVPGKLGQAINFDGVDDYVTKGTGVAFTKTSSFSGSAWVKTDSSGAIVSNLNYALSPGWIFAVSLIGTNNLEFGIVNDDVSAGRYRRGSTNIKDGKWHFVSFTYDGSNAVTGIQLYVDGTLETMTTFLNTDPGTLVDSGLEIGSTMFNSALQTFTFASSIDDVRIYNRALSASEIKRLYEQGATTHINTTIDTNDDLENGLALHYTFDGPKMNWSSSTAEVLDSSSSSIEGDLINMDQQSVTTGKMGQGLRTRFNAEVVDATSVPSLDNIASITVGVWLKLDNRSDISTNIITYKASTVAGIGWTLYMDATSLYWDRDFSGTDGRWSISPSTAIGYDSGRWMHVAVTYSTSSTSSIPRMYFNGEALSLSTVSAPTGSASSDASYNLLVSDSSFTLPPGIIDDFRVYNRILSASEVKRLYEMGATTHINTTIDTNDDLESGLVGHWTFDGPKMAWASTTAEVIDSSASSIEGDLVNMDTSAAIAGKIGQGLRFDAVDDAVNAGEPSIFQDLPQISISAWIKPNSSGGGNCLGSTVLVQKNESCNIAGDGWLFSMYPNNALIFQADYFNGLAQDMYRLTSNNFVALNTWQHVVATWTGSSSASTAHIYRNGQEETTYALSQNGTLTRDNEDLGSSPLTIGGMSSGDASFDGTIDDVRVYNRALSAAEIKRLYELGGGR